MDDDVFTNIPTTPGAFFQAVEDETIDFLDALYAAPIIAAQEYALHCHRKYRERRARDKEKHDAQESQTKADAERGV